ncbi:hypothetical protein KDK_38860 [Dictyobacter kobayashii]|uniref:Short-chain dehydrogenase n=1 Tax=Dictyobacter kobayashii TaxID=2014872 RepID=A0A402ALU2_9CHLR|nr:hypothetical protein KDK_38860 [Dictyobacter kobayashii]
MTETTGRVALVTGASSGIGAATARLLAARGMRVVVNYLHSGTAAGEVVAGIKAANGQAMAVQADVREAAAVESMIKQVQAAWGGIDVLVHNALTPYVIKPFQDMTWEELGGKLDDEMRAAFTITKAVLPTMTEQGWGRIIYLGTGLSRQPREGMIALGTAKADWRSSPATSPRNWAREASRSTSSNPARWRTPAWRMCSTWRSKDSKWPLPPWAAWHTRTTSPR